MKLKRFVTRKPNFHVTPRELKTQTSLMKRKEGKTRQRVKMLIRHKINPDFCELADTIIFENCSQTEMRIYTSYFQSINEYLVNLCLISKIEKVAGDKG